MFFCRTNEIKSPGKNVTAVIKWVYMDTRSDMMAGIKRRVLVRIYVVNFGMGKCSLSMPCFDGKLTFWHLFRSRLCSWKLQMFICIYVHFIVYITTKVFFVYTLYSTYFLYCVFVTTTNTIHDYIKPKKGGTYYMVLITCIS